MLSKEGIERIIEIIEELKSKQKCVFLVEGKKDRESLEYLGIEHHKIIEVSHKTPQQIALHLIEIKVEEIIDFLDNDKEGVKIASNIKRKNVHLNTKYKKEIMSLLKIRNVENIKNKIKKEKKLSLMLDAMQHSPQQSKYP